MSQPIPLEGVFTPVATPFDQDGRVAHDMLVANLEKWNQTPLLGYIVLGSNGEAAYLSEAEKEAVLRTARQAIPAGKLMIAGTGLESTVNTVELTRRAAGIGADAALVVHPCYYKSQMTTPVLASHYRLVADASPIPILIYNVPPATGMELPAELIVELSFHPNIIGVKDTAGNMARMGEVVRQAATGFQVLAGSANFFYPSLAIGAIGGILALGNVAPEESVAMLSHYRAGDLDRGRELHLRMLPVNLAVTTRFGVSGLKAAMDMLGYYGGPPRRPLMPLDEPQRRELSAILRNAGLAPTR